MVDAPMPLAHGDEIRIGPILLTFPASARHRRRPNPTASLPATLARDLSLPNHRLVASGFSRKINGSADHSAAGGFRLKAEATDPFRLKAEATGGQRDYLKCGVDRSFSGR